jgi:hypothetical protein
MNHPEIDKLAKQNIFEIVKYPAYFPDTMIMDMIRSNTDTHVIYYIALMNGIIPIVTLGNYKSFVADFSKRKKKI